MIHTLINSVKNANFKKLVQIMKLSAVFLMTGVWTAAVAGTPDSGRTGQPFRWETSGCRFSLKHGEQTVWRFNADTSGGATPYFDPLCVVDGPSLVLSKPADHPWHLGHWFSWKYINGANYWETDEDGHAQGETFWETPMTELNSDGSARITLDLGYRPRTGERRTLLRERREIVISAPSVDGSYTLDWTQHFTAQQDVILDRTPVPGEKDGVNWGGYAGLAIRFSNDLKDIKTITSRSDSLRTRTGGVVDIYGAAAVEQNGVIDGQEYGIAVLPYPGTPRRGDWYVITTKDFTYINPAILLRGKYNLNKGETLTLRHRVHIHRGRWETAQLNESVDALNVEHPEPTAASIKTLIVTGQNNHNWQVSHVALKNILEHSGLFTVDVAVSPPEGGDMSAFQPDFRQYRLVVLDYNGDEWTAEMQRRFTEYAENGGGIVVYHAAGAPFPHWIEYNQIIGLGGWNGRNEQSGPWIYLKNGKWVKDHSPGAAGSHGVQHEFTMNLRDRQHPITKDLPERWKHATDELYDRLRGQGDINILYSAYSDKEKGGSGREEPLLFTVDYGKARIFHTALGHAWSNNTPENNTAMQCTGFQVTLLRGCEWAATGNVTQTVPSDFPAAGETSSRLNYK